jgi:hypothetical protein
MIMTIGNRAFSSVYKKKIDRLYTILQKNGGTDTKPEHVILKRFHIKRNKIFKYLKQCLDN